MSRCILGILYIALEHIKKIRAIKFYSYCLESWYDFYVDTILLPIEWYVVVMYCTSSLFQGIIIKLITKLRNFNLGCIQWTLEWTDNKKNEVIIRCNYQNMSIEERFRCDIKFINLIGLILSLLYRYRGNFIYPVSVDRPYA